MLIETDHRPALRTMALHDIRTNVNVRVPDMASDNPATYFEALLREGCVIAPDCKTHLVTAPFLSSYFGPQNVFSLLDVSFSVNGILYGCFSCEQIGVTHEWSPHQVKLLRRMASRVSLALVHTITSHVDTQPGALWAPSTPNRLMTMPMPLERASGDAKACSRPRAPSALDRALRRSPLRLRWRAAPGG